MRVAAYGSKVGRCRDHRLAQESFNTRTIVFEHSSGSRACRASSLISAARIPSEENSSESSSRIVPTAAW
jgi:hypothetical protein